MVCRLCIAIFSILLFTASESLSQQHWYHNLRTVATEKKNATSQFALQTIDHSWLIQVNRQSNELSGIHFTSLKESISINGLQFHTFEIEAASFNPIDSVLYFTAEHRNTKTRLYTSSYRNQKWTDPTPMVFSSESSDDHHPYYDCTSHTLYFASRRTGGYGGLDIWSCKNKDGNWTAPKNVGAGVNTPMNEMQPTICRNDLIYSSDQDVQNAGFDLRVAPSKSVFNSSLSLSDVVNSSRNDLRLVQLNQNKFALMRSDHKKTDSYEWVILTSDDELPAFTYRLVRNDRPAIDQSVMINSINTEPKIYTSDSQGRLILNTLNHTEKLQIQLIQNSMPCEFQVLDANSEILLSLTLKPGETITLEPLDLLYSQAERWYPGDESSLISETSEMRMPPGFLLHVNSNSEPLAVANYRIESTGQYHAWQLMATDECNHELPQVNTHLPLMAAEIPVALSKKTTTCIAEDVWRIDRIYFESSEDKLNETAKAQCKIILELLLLNPDLIIELTGSTDFEGSTEFNHNLGLQRALNVQSELIQYGIPSSRVRAYTRGENCRCANSDKQIQDFIAPILRRVDIKYQHSSGH